MASGHGIGGTATGPSFRRALRKCVCVCVSLVRRRGSLPASPRRLSTNAISKLMSRFCARPCLSAWPALVRPRWVAPSPPRMAPGGGEGGLWGRSVWMPLRSAPLWAAPRAEVVAAGRVNFAFLRPPQNGCTPDLRLRAMKKWYAHAGTPPGLIGRLSASCASEACALVGGEAPFVRVSLGRQRSRSGDSSERRCPSPPSLGGDERGHRRGQDCDAISWTTPRRRPWHARGYGQDRSFDAHRAFATCLLFVAAASCSCRRFSCSSSMPSQIGWFARIRRRLMTVRSACDFSTTSTDTHQKSGKKNAAATKCVTIPSALRQPPRPRPPDGRGWARRAIQFVAV